MRFSHVLTGIILIALPASAIAATTPLYDRMKKEVTAELSVEQVDQTLIPYLQAVFKSRWELNATQMTEVLKGNIATICAAVTTANGAKNLPDCVILQSTVRALADDESRIRSLGRTLQAAATSFELPVSDLPGRTLKLSADLRGILNIWSAGTGSVKTRIEAPIIRTSMAERSDHEADVEEIGNYLRGLSKEKMTGVIWRYQYGVRLLRNDRAPRFPSPRILPNSGDDTERQYLSRRAEDGEFEDLMLRIWDRIKNENYDPPITLNETVYITFPTELIDAALPDNVIIWARIDGDRDGNYPFGDVGLQWQVPLEPVMPSLMGVTNNQPILGGDYPPEPAIRTGNNMTVVDGEGLCTSPTAMRGFLCRAFKALSDEDRCPVPNNLDPNAINLIHCEIEKDERYTAAGADVCREVAWKSPQPFNPQTQCTIRVACGCDPGAGASAAISTKNNAGEIRVCMQENSADIQTTYLLYHELVHGYQYCGQPPGYGYQDVPNGGGAARDAIQDQNAAFCCRLEGEGYQAMCDMMERDGIFDNAGVGDNGIPFNAETCAEAMTHASCSANEKTGFQGCYTSRTYTPAFFGQLLTLSAENPRDLPETCSAATDPATMDPRVAGLIEAIERRDDACRPSENTEYKNRIGNNACYIGQCVEQSVELHRIVGGRQPTGVQDEIAPWDVPETGTPLANVLMNPPTTQTRLPPYRPQLLVRELEKAFCQAQGLPPLTPPVLCAIRATRQLDATRIIGAEAAGGLLGQRSEQELTADDLLFLSPALAARMGTQLYGDYLRESNRAFAGIIDMANDLLTDMKKIDFPAEMCPLGPGLPAPIN